MDTLFSPIDRFSLCHRPHASIWLFSLVWGSYLILVQSGSARRGFGAEFLWMVTCVIPNFSKGNHVFFFFLPLVMSSFSVITYLFLSRFRVVLERGGFSCHELVDITQILGVLI
ncbi:hypothetical protein BDV23DRAFT_126357 [Aspergillus alliaceus]|uniref:Uncharacterized protein n=1 Tax=Petromyces alliaceus TaxID=209559 RepID=A0A5N7CKV4_PETAA|nr:hypothetical protein BDV23DRAFT_126357 [Aspergillus alliaceus]